MKRLTLKTIERTSLTVLLICLLCAAYLLYAYRARPSSAQPTTANPTARGYMQFRVRNGMTDEPIENAQIVIPETGAHLTTRQDGTTSTIEVPVFEQSHYKSIYERPWGTITLLVYAPGYIDYALFEVQVWPNETRIGPTIMMFPKEDSAQVLPFSIVEGPERNWVCELLERYRPQPDVIEE